MMEYDADRRFAKRCQRLRRHRRWILAGTALCVLGGLMLSLLSPKIYRATTYILVSESKIGPAPSTPTWQYAMLPTYVPFVDNDELLAKAIQHFHLDRAPYHLTVDRFRRSNYLDVKIPKSTRLLEISVEFPDARLAADLANYLAQTAVEFNNQMNATDTLAMQAFLKQRMDQAASHLAVAEAKRLQAREQAHLEDREKELSILLGQKEKISSQLEQFRLALAQDESRARSLEQALRGEPRTLQLKKSLTSDRFLERASEKLKLENQAALSSTEEIVNTTRDALQSQYADAAADAAAGQAGVKAASARLADIDAQTDRLLAEVTRLRSEIDKADRDFTLAREAFESASRDYRNASMTVSAKSQDLKQVAPALIPERPTRPRPLLNTVLALLLGLVLLSGIALAIESFRDLSAETTPFIVEDEPVEAHRSREA